MLNAFGSCFVVARAVTNAARDTEVGKLGFLQTRTCERRQASGSNCFACSVLSTVSRSCPPATVGYADSTLIR